MSDHSSFAATATRLIAKHGRNVTLRTVTSSGDAWDPTQANSDATVKAVVVAIDKAHFGSGLAKADDLSYLIDSAQVVSVGQIIIDTDTLKIYRVEEIKPGDQSIMYRVFARQ